MRFASAVRSMAATAVNVARETVHRLAPVRSAFKVFALQVVLPMVAEALVQFIAGLFTGKSVTVSTEGWA